MDEMNKDKSSSSQDDALSQIAKREVLSSGLRNLAGIFIGLALLIVAHAIFTTYKMLSDRSVPVVTCPRVYDLDAPVLMKTIDAKGIQAQDRWIRGFMRRFITMQFPRTAQDVQPFFEYIEKHSKGDINYKFRSLLKDVNDIRDMVKNGFFYRFYPKSADDLRIRTVQGYNNRWVVEIDGYLVKKMSITQERYTPTLRYVVEAGVPTFDNPEGLYVIEGDIEQITDYVSGRKESL
jgi:hypothetical protein